MAVDSGTYDPETVARHQAIAAQLLKQAAAPQEIRSRTQGIAQLGQGLIAGLTARGADQEAKDERSAAVAQALAAFGGGQTPAPAQPAPAAAPVGADSSMPPTTLVGNNPDIPRGIRNNNPLNIEAGGFTQGQPGFAGSDGRFAKFDTPEQGTAAASALLDSYGRKGLNTPAGIIGRWAPAGDGNNVSAYAANVAKALGIGPNDAIPPQMRPQLIAAMGQQETGRPINGVATALNAPPVAAGQPPVAGAPPVPQQVAQNAPAPATTPAAGGPNRDAIIKALMNPWTPPAVANLLAQQGFAKPELKDAGTDPITGAKSYQEYDPNTHTMRPVGGAPGTPQAAAQPGMLAQGVSQIDHTLTGDAYLKQFGPEVQSAVKSYMNGDVMPTGNPRMASIANAAKTIAQKYGQDTGIPVSDAIYGAKRKMQVDLASSAPNSTGGILANGKSAFAHLADAGDKLVDIGNVSSNVPIVGGNYAAARNYVGNVLTPTSEQKGKLTAAADNLLKYGQEATKFYAGSGGGEGERMAALKNHDIAKSSGYENAAFLGTEKQLMLDRLHQKELQIRDTMGDKYLEDHPVMTPDLKTKIDRIDANIEKLRGDKPEGETAPNDGWKDMGNGVRIREKRSDVSDGSFNVAANTGPKGGVPPLPMNPMTRSLQRRLNNADDDEAIMKIRKWMEKNGADPDSVPQLRIG